MKYLLLIHSDGVLLTLQKMIECGALHQSTWTFAFGICGNMNLISCSFSVYVNFLICSKKNEETFLLIQGKAGAGEDGSPLIAIKDFSLQLSNNLRGYGPGQSNQQSPKLPLAIDFWILCFLYSKDDFHEQWIDDF